MKNGVHAREMLADIFDALSVDPWIVTDVYNEEARAGLSDFKENRHDQCLVSLSAKLLGSEKVIHAPTPSLKAFKNRTSAFGFTRLKARLHERVYAYWKEQCPIAAANSTSTSTASTSNQIQIQHEPMDNGSKQDLFCDSLACCLNEEDVELAKGIMDEWNKSIDEILV